MSDGAPVDINAVLAELSDPWQPRDLAIANGAVLRVARLHGEFPWHHHEEDELFLCWDGAFSIELEGCAPVTLHPGQLFVVPAGMQHRPVAEQPACALMFERLETRQHGN